ncbi:MAG: hypothetical protein IT178_12080 [Acidobacteria bacterium]|nr:hypothetical protein [Acidobacteriota bacterium]
MRRRLLIVTCGIVAGLLATFPPDTEARQTGRLEYRVVQAAPYQLQLVVDEAGRDGFTCVSVARPELDARMSSVVVILARPYVETTHVASRVAHRVVRAFTSSDLSALLDRGAAEGYRLCGVALAEGTPGAVLAAVMSPDTERPRGGRRYVTELLGNSERRARLTARGREGFVPVAATPIGDNRILEQRSWLVVAEQTTTQPVDIVVRSGPGPDSLEKAILEQSQQGFVCRLFWKEGLTSMVVVMVRLPVDPTHRPEFDVDTIDPARLDRLSGVYIGDVSYLGDGQRVVLRINEAASTTYVVTDPLPPVGPRDYASAGDLQALGDHLGRDRSHDRARVVSSSVRRGPRDVLMLHTVLTQFGR